MVMSENSFVEKPKRVNHLKMVVIDYLQADTISNTVNEHVDSHAELTTDDATPYSKLAEHVKSHHAQVIKPEELPKILPWVHIAIGNVKRLLLDVHHQLTKEYLQYYLNEFCYKFNRRYFGEAIFDRLLVAVVSYNYELRSIEAFMFSIAYFLLISLLSYCNQITRWQKATAMISNS